MKRVGATMIIVVVVASVLVLALSAAETHDRALVAFRQVNQAESELPRPRQDESFERRERPVRPNPRDPDQMLILLLLLEMGSPASRR